MPGFTGHTTANTLLLVGTSAFLLERGWGTLDVIAIDAGIAISTLVLSPDMDLFTSKSMEDWGILRFFWWPYAKLVKHRDRLHTPILGTTVRWAYLLILLMLGLLVLRVALEQIGLRVDIAPIDPKGTFLHYARYVAEMFIGGNLADAVHFFLDVSTHGLEHGVPRRQHVHASMQRHFRRS
jgi:uncharacterized metal-binding protein